MSSISIFSHSPILHSPIDINRLSVQDLLTLRSLGKKPSGIALERLNAGEKKKGKQKGKNSDDSGKQTEEEKWHDQMRNGGLVAKSAAVPAGGEDR